MIESELTDSDDGALREIEVGQTVRICLREVPTTGYRWSPQAFDEDCINLLDEGWVATGTGVGGGGTRVFRLLIQRKGSFVLALKLWCEWLGEDSVIDHRRFTLIAK